MATGTNTFEISSGNGSSNNAWSNLNVVQSKMKMSLF